jgi:membrane associated rhomboid family serine protease
VLPVHDNVPTRSFPLVTLGLIVTNFIVFFWELSGGRFEQHVFRYSYYPCAVDGPCLGPAGQHHLPFWEGAFTSMFMHAGWAHILGNMLFLWIFGNNVEDAMGKVRFLVFYLCAGLAATALQTFVTLHISGTAGASVPNLGASGAIAGVLGAYLLLLPWAKVLTFIGIFPIYIPAVFFLGFWFVMQALLGNLALHHPEASGGVAVFAHIGGMVFGLLTVFLFIKRRPLRPTF